MQQLKQQFGSKSTNFTVTFSNKCSVSIKDFEPMSGKSNQVYKILKRKQSLTLAMIRKLHANLGIPSESLIK